MAEQQEEEFIKEIIARPDEDAPRLVYADWLQEKGELADDPALVDRAEFIRKQIDLARHMANEKLLPSHPAWTNAGHSYWQRKGYSAEQAQERIDVFRGLHDRTENLLSRHRDEWMEYYSQYVTPPEWASTHKEWFVFHRGIPDWLVMTDKERELLDANNTSNRTGDVETQILYYLRDINNNRDIALQRLLRGFCAGMSDVTPAFWETLDGAMHIEDTSTHERELNATAALYLLSAGADANAQVRSDTTVYTDDDEDVVGVTLLHPLMRLAACRYNPDVRNRLVKGLIAHGSDPNHRIGGTGETLLDVFLGAGEPDKFVQRLREWGAKTSEELARAVDTPDVAATSREVRRGRPRTGRSRGSAHDSPVTPED